MQSHPSVKDVLTSVCEHINANGPSLYSDAICKLIPITAEDILSGPGKYRIHSDARTIAAIILRKHVLMPYSFDEMKIPTLQYVGRSLKMTSAGGLTKRIVKMCELMRKNPAYRSVYVQAVQRLVTSGFNMWRTEHIEHAVPCQ